MASVGVQGCEGIIDQSFVLRTHLFALWDRMILSGEHDPGAPFVAQAIAPLENGLLFRVYHILLSCTTTGPHTGKAFLDFLNNEYTVTRCESICERTILHSIIQ